MLYRFSERNATISDDGILQANLDFLVDQVRHAGKFDMPKIAEADLIRLMEVILEQNGGTVTVGKMGSLMHEATNNHSLPAMIKTRFGGLKKLLKRHEHIFHIASDHPHNPHVSIRPPASRRASLDAAPSLDISTKSTSSPVQSMRVLLSLPTSPTWKLESSSPLSLSYSKSGSFTLSGDRKSSSADLDLDSASFLGMQLTPESFKVKRCSRTDIAVQLD